MAQRRTGPCHLCGNITELTFEHVPPRAAFNKYPAIIARFEDTIKAESVDDIDRICGQKQQRGLGSFTLCGKCNNDTGAWYGESYVQWAYQGLIAAEWAKGKVSTNNCYKIYPLRVIKQIVSMFFSSGHARFNEAQPELARFVLDKERKYLEPDIRI